jgi:hypothetical protein
MKYSGKWVIALLATIIENTKINLKQKKMKSRIIPFIVIALVIMTSCAPVTFYQVYKTKPTSEISISESSLVFEDDFCKISYDMWSNGGNVGFNFYNKTEKNIYLDLSECFFVLNGSAYNYYKNRIYTEASSSSSTVSKTTTTSKAITGYNNNDLLQSNRMQSSKEVGAISSSAFSVSYNEEKIVCIPSKTTKRIAEYKVNKTLYRDCDLFKYPTKKQIKTKAFSHTNSPIVFSNRLTYSVENSNDRHMIENEFFISEITNYPEDDLIEYITDKFCEQESVTKTSYFKISSPDMFFIEYKKGQDYFKH